MISILRWESQRMRGWVSRKQGRTGLPGCLALARWAGWFASQVGRHVKCWSTSSEKYSGSLCLPLSPSLIS